MSAPSRMLVVDPSRRTVVERDIEALPSLLLPSDLLVVNDAATFPASLRGVTRVGAPVEARLLEAPYARRTRAVLFGDGDHRTPTEHRAAPPLVRVGERLRFGRARIENELDVELDVERVELEVVEVSTLSPRLVTLEWSAQQAARFRALYAIGRPVQYSHDPAPLALYDVQTPYARRPFAAEVPSAGRPLRWSVLRALAARGVEVVSLTHAAGLSATGDAALDAALPLPEHTFIPEATATRVRAARARGRRVIAVGTSVVRSLEDSAARHGRVVAGPAITRLVLDGSTTLRVTSGLLTGVHAPEESHFRLLRAFVDEETLAASFALASARGYALHERGESCLVLPRVSSALAA